MIHFKPSWITKHFNYKVGVLLFLLTAILPFLIFEIINSPDDYLQGVYAKILYIHVPSAQLAIGLYVAMSATAFGFLVSKNAAYDLLTRAILPVGMLFSAITLFTGSVWGKPTWGTWWVWDARLTSVLVLFLIYFLVLSIYSSYGRKREKASIIASYIAIFGLINIPIIKFSVYMWNTLHQTSSLFRSEGVAIHESMLMPLLLSIAFFCLLATTLVLINFYRHFLERKAAAKSI